MKNINIKKGIKRVLAGTIVLTSLSTNALAYQYVIKRGDTLRKISKEAYGTPSYSTELANYNSILNPNFIREGEIIEIPSVDTIKKCKYFIFTDNEPKQNEVYRVKKGDTLEKIAFAYYGKEAFAQLLAEYNCLETNILYEGQLIFVPSYSQMLEFCNAIHNIGKGKTNVKTRNI